MSMTSVIRYVKALDTSSTTGAGKTGLAYSDITAKYVVDGGTLTTLTTETITTLGTYQAPTDASHIRIKELSSSDPCKGVYEVHFHDTQMATGAKLVLMLSATGALFEPYEVGLENISGRLPAALTSDGNIKADTLRVNGTAQTAGDIYSKVSGLTFTVSNQVDVNVKSLLGTAWLTPGTAGTPDVNAKLIGGTSQTGRDIGATLGVAGAGLTNLGDTRIAHLDADVSSRVATSALPSNFSSLAIDSSGRTNAFLIGILTSTFTEGATGRVAAGFKQWFNVASPTSTMNEVTLVDTVTTLTNAPSDSSGVTTLLGRLTSARAGYLDNLSGTIIQTGTVVSAGSNSIVIQTALGADHLAEGLSVYITSGTGAGQGRSITLYQNAGKLITVDRAWTVQPDNTSTYVIRYERVTPLSSDTNTVPVDVSYWNSSHDVVGNVGDIFADAGLIDADINGNVIGRVLGAAGENFIGIGVWAAGAAGAMLPLQADITGGSYALNTSAAGNVGVDWSKVQNPTSTVNLSGTTVGTVTTLTNAPSDSSGVTTLLGRLTSTRAGYLDNISSAPPTAAAVAAAVLATTLMELTTDPGASPALGNALCLLYMDTRNRKDVTSDAKTIYNDAGTELFAKALSDDGTTYTEAKMVAV